MNKINRFAIIGAALTTALLLTETASAQLVVTRRKAPVMSTEQPQPRVEPAKQLPEAAFAGTIRGTISWPLSQGLPPMYLGATEPYALPCGLIAIRAEAKNASGRHEIIASVSSTRAKPEDVETLVCNYEIASLPLDKEIHIWAEFLDYQLFNSRWISNQTEDGFVTLPSGYSRTFIGEVHLTLTRTTSTSERNFTLGRSRRWGTPPIY